MVKTNGTYNFVLFEMGDKKPKVDVGVLPSTWRASIYLPFVLSNSL